MFYERRGRIIAARYWAINILSICYMGASWHEHGFSSLGMGLGMVTIVGAWICVEMWQANLLKEKELGTRVK